MENFLVFYMNYWSLKEKAFVVFFFTWITDRSVWWIKSDVNKKHANFGHWLMYSSHLWEIKYWKCLGQAKHLASPTELNKYWSKFLASPIERSWFQRPRLVKALSRSSASESWEAIATSELDDMLNMLSSEAILAILAFGDMEDALRRMTGVNNIHEKRNSPFILDVLPFGGAKKLQN